MEIYYKNTCTTCKKALDVIARMKKDVEKRDYFKDPFSEEELKKIIKMTGKKPQELLRKHDKTYKELNIGEKKYSDSQIIKLMLKHPNLIMRPIIITKDHIHIGKTALDEI